VVTREELRGKLWPGDTFGDFDHGLNAAVKRLRDALGDDPENPRFVETLARRGYRFIVPIVQDAGPQSEARQRTPTSGSAPPVTPASSAAVQVAEPRNAGGRKLWKTTVPAAVLVIALVGILAWLGRPLPPPRVLQTTQITHDGVTKQNGALTDGSRLYIAETYGGNTFLVEVSVTGGETSTIPTPFANIGISDISPDHSQLLSESLVGTEEEGQLWTVPIPAGAPRRLPDLVGHFGAWSRDGRRLAFGKGSDIYMANGDGTDARKLITLSGPAHSIRFSPDGTRLRFTVYEQRANSASIWEVRVDGADFHPVLPGWRSPPSECCGVWSADGRYYLFVSNVSDGSSNIWALREPARVFHRRPSAPFKLTTGPMSLRFPVPSPDGRRLFAEGRLPRGELVRYDSQSHQFAPFLSGISAGELDFSRDGKWVAYVSYPERTLWRSRVDGSESLQLTYAPVAASLPRWSPDGTQIAYFHVQAGQPYRIFLISAGGGTPQQVMLSEMEHQLDPTWSPDGKQITVGGAPTASSGKIVLRIVDLNSRQVSTIPGSENLYSPRWSPEGRHLAALSADSKKLLLYNFKTQKWTDWINETGAIGFPAWSRDGRYVYYDTTSTKKLSFRRVKVGETRSEFLIDLKNLRRYGGYGEGWSGLAPDDSALLVRDMSTDEIYSLDVELP
jgi:Tol biopolymer transport system component